MVTKLHTQLLKPPHIQAGVLLFFLQGLEDSGAEGFWRIGKFQQHERHQFRGEQFVIGKEVKQFAAALFVFQRTQARKIGVRRAGPEFQIGGSTRLGRRDQARARIVIKQ